MTDRQSTSGTICRGHAACTTGSTGPPGTPRGAGHRGRRPPTAPDLAPGAVGSCPLQAPDRPSPLHAREYPSHTLAVPIEFPIPRRALRALGRRRSRRGARPPVRSRELRVRAKVGATAPPFDLETDTGERLPLNELKRQTVVLYFYPKDDTTGCTQEACEFRDLFPRFEKSPTVILGISPDSWRKHRNFKKNTACRSRSSWTRITPLQNATASGSRSCSGAGSTLAWSAPRSSSHPTAKSGRSSPRWIPRVTRQRWRRH